MCSFDTLYIWRYSIVINIHLMLIDLLSRSSFILKHERALMHGITQHRRCKITKRMSNGFLTKETTFGPSFEIGFYWNFYKSEFSHIKWYDMIEKSLINRHVIFPCRYASNVKSCNRNSTFLTSDSHVEQRDEEHWNHCC